MIEFTHEERYQDDLHEHPLFSLTGQLLDQLLAGFETYRTTNQLSASDMECTSKPPSSNNAVGYVEHTTGDSKGKRKAFNQGDQTADDSDDDIPPRRTKKPKATKSGRAKHPLFACPFFEKDPAKFNNCHRYILRRVRDVNQHLRRCHCLPINCPICMCGQAFAEEPDRDAHTRQTACQEREIALKV